MTGDEINRRLLEHRCVVCGLEISDWQYGVRSEDGFTYTECRDHRGKHLGRTPEKANKKAEREQGIENLRKLGA